MPFPEGWPPKPATGVKSLRIRITGSGTADFADNAYLWIDQVAASNPFTPLPIVEPGGGVSKPGYTGPHNVDTPPVGSGVDSDGNKGSIWSSHIAIEATGGALEFSFDGTTIHGIVPDGQRYEFSDRYEAGICVRGASATFVIEAW